MGDATSLLLAVFNSLLLLSTLAKTQDLGTDKSSIARTSTAQARQISSSYCCNCRQPVGKNDGKKGEVYGFDGGKLVKGRKRHIIVDTLGLLMSVVVTEANASERLGATVALLEQCCDAKALELMQGRFWI